VSCIGQYAPLSPDGIDEKDAKAILTHKDYDKGQCKKGCTGQG
jgi:hypothetical protein